MHENKGVAAATDNTVATAVTGATVWAKLTASNLTGTGNSFGAQLLHVQHQVSSGTSGGSNATGAFTIHPLTTVLTNEISGAALSSNQLTLPAGTYFCTARAVFSQTDATKLKIRNVSDSTDLLIGMSNQQSNGSGANNWEDTVSGRFTLAGTKTIELQYRCQTGVSGFGLGRPCNFGVVEVYAEVLIWKVL